MSDSPKENMQRSDALKEIMKEAFYKPMTCWTVEELGAEVAAGSLAGSIVGLDGGVLGALTGFVTGVGAAVVTWTSLNYAKEYAGWCPANTKILPDVTVGHPNRE